MTNTLDNLPKPEPDVESFKTMLRKGVPDRVPLVELAIADELLAEINGQPLAPYPPDDNSIQLRMWADQRVRLWWRIGYDYYRIRAEIPFTIDRLSSKDTAALASGNRQWVNEHQGIIRSHRDVDNYNWPQKTDINLAQIEALINCLPEGMGGIGFSGGVLEWASTLFGLENFSLMLYDNPGLVREVVDHVGQVIYETFDMFCQMEVIFAIWLGDDLGFKTSTLIKPEHLRKYILPWHRKYAELAHRTHRFFLLHSCGHIEAVMPDLINNVGIDAKHSFEDVIMPVEEFKQNWGKHIAILGGVDVDLLCRGTVSEVCERTKQILDICASEGGYACGSGNSVTNYVQPANYLAMIETVHRYNGRL
ncbi:MAG: uroporphyrinogen-III decarboxylase-like protein [Planctomycetota bacterium]|nr:MAG: uroporphyrinogen-III decarboxylase-like protein [Planctomycetota bacterium]